MTGDDDKIIKTIVALCQVPPIGAPIALDAICGFVLSLDIDYEAPEKPRPGLYLLYQAGLVIGRYDTAEQSLFEKRKAREGLSDTQLLDETILHGPIVVVASKGTS